MVACRPNFSLRNPVVWILNAATRPRVHAPDHAGDTSRSRSRRDQAPSQTRTGSSEAHSEDRRRRWAPGGCAGPFLRLMYPAAPGDRHAVALLSRVSKCRSKGSLAVQPTISSDSGPGGQCDRKCRWRRRTSWRSGEDGADGIEYQMSADRGHLQHLADRRHLAARDSAHEGRNSTRGVGQLSLLPSDICSW